MSVIPTVEARICCQDSQGKAVAGALVTATLTGQERYLGQAVPASAQGVTDDFGVVILPLFPNDLGSEGSAYSLTAQFPQGGTIVRFVAIPYATCDIVLGPRVSAAVAVRLTLEEILAARDEVALLKTGVVLSASAAATRAEQARASQVAAAASATAAALKATEAGAAATTAAGSAAQASGKAAEASQSASLASTRATAAAASALDAIAAAQDAARIAVTARPQWLVPAGTEVSVGEYQQYYVRFGRYSIEGVIALNVGAQLIVEDVI